MDISRLELMAEYGFDVDPLDDESKRIETADSLRIKRIVKMAIASKSMISIVGDYGYGKSNCLKLAFRDITATRIEITCPDKEHLKIGEIELSMMLTLTKETKKQSKIIRSEQLRRIIGQAAKEKPVVLVLEEAHRLHGQTLRSLKSLREMEWMGHSPLFTIIMLAQYNPMRKPGVDEVRLRTDTINLKGLTGSEIKTYIKTTVGRYFDTEAIDAITELENARNYLELRAMLVDLMAKALQNGSKNVTCLDVFELYGGGLAQVIKRAGITQSEIEKETGINKTSLSLVLNNKPNTLSPEKSSEIRSAITDVLKRKLEEEGGQAKTKLTAVAGGQS
jgi:type II secretory pathway predicted ATPase ExeA